MPNFLVSGIVSHRDQKPYIQLSNENGMIAQMSMGEARQVAMDILVMASRTEMDALVFDWAMKEAQLGSGAAASLMLHFREYRAKLDDEQVGHDHRIPPEGE